MYEALKARYGVSCRQYHNWVHIEECFNAYQNSGIRFWGRQEALLCLAIFYHDAIYDTKSKNNEHNSALLCAADMRARFVEKEAQDRVRELIMATVHSGTPQTFSECLIADIDLSMLGMPWIDHLENSRSIRLEYSQYSDAEFAAGRAKFMSTFLERPVLYHTPYFQRLCDVQARSNLSREIAMLTNT